MSESEAQARTPETVAMHPRIGVSVAVVQGDAVLMAQRGKAPMAGLWSFPGGHLEMGETLHQGALRELAEETGVTAEIVRLVDVVEVLRTPDTHYVITVFAARWIASEALAASDCADVRWVDRDGLTTLATTPDAPRLARRALDIVQDATPASGFTPPKQRA